MEEAGCPASLHVHIDLEVERRRCRAEAGLPVMRLYVYASDAESSDRICVLPVLPATTHGPRLVSLSMPHMANQHARND